MKADRIWESLPCDEAQAAILARELGVSTMALYRHVSSRDALLLMMAGCALRGSGVTYVLFAGKQPAGGHALSMKRQQQHRDENDDTTHSVSSLSLTRLFH